MRAISTRGARRGDSGLQRSSGKYPWAGPERRVRRVGSSEMKRCIAKDNQAVCKAPYKPNIKKQHDN